MTSENIKGGILGFLVITLANIFSISIDYTFKLTNVRYNEFVLVGGAAISLLYMLIIVIKKEWPLFEGPYEIFLSVVMTALIGFGTVASIYTVRLMPLTDAAVIRYTFPIFAILTARFLLGVRINLFKLIFACGIFIGVGMVVKPASLLKLWNQENNLTLSENQTALQQSIQENDTELGMEFLFGVTVAFVGACALGSFTVFAKRLYKALKMNHIILSHGLGLLITTPVFLLTGVQNRFIANPNVLDITEAWPLALVTALFIAKANCMAYGLEISSPVLVSAVRSMEIVMVLLFETLYFQNAVDAWSIAGSITVLLCVLAISLLDYIVAKAQPEVQVERVRIK